MEINLVTKEDLIVFKAEMLVAIREALTKASEDGLSKKQWFRSADVRRMLGISPGTLQTLRINGKLPYRKIGGSMFYHASDIEKMLKEGQQYG
ncbi:helix-turn-helix domain-containing protein [Sphingobacterium psychroaquaticum]|uniref:Helix-turn-helix domain-containing protein n=1 Tax=Sphingobacterium psychroaquaticum TaxID=561061 RepID=A0A1X7IE32_9SPHI|nr:helix-turn-helix domain-containing protein [Sphingobacterium psychroaquaticum]SMG12909.1 Helix-turn-helix domain-containing protein [Sphingobacterium psychroaquaticum]